MSEARSRAKSFDSFLNPSTSSEGSSFTKGSFHEVLRAVPKRRPLRAALSTTSFFSSSGAPSAEKESSANSTRLRYSSLESPTARPVIFSEGRRKLVLRDAISALALAPFSMPFISPHLRSGSKGKKKKAQSRTSSVRRGAMYDQRILHPPLEVPVKEPGGL